MNEKEKEKKCDELRKEFEEVMSLEENRIEEVIKNSSDLL
jgi:hypothetical protein